MRKIVLICGSIAGVIIATVVLISMAIIKESDLNTSMMIGYATMLLAFSLIYVGVKNYRDKHSDGFISFGKAFRMGLYISLVASTIYVAIWLVDYYFFVPDYMDKYAAAVLEQARAEGASQLVLNETAAEMASYKEMYKNPVMVVLFTYLEILPVGVVVSLISALLLKRKGGNQVQAAV
jgi:hypothetical protein